MRLSEAIRLGSMMKPQAFGGLNAVQERRVFGQVLGLHPDEKLATCALGAAFDAANCSEGVKSHDGVATSFRGGPVAVGESVTTILVPADWFDLFHSEHGCPACGKCEPLQRVIAHLNDEHRWSREAIAQFVERIEGPPAADAVDPHLQSEGMPSTRVKASS